MKLNALSMLQRGGQGRPHYYLATDTERPSRHALALDGTEVALRNMGDAGVPPRHQVDDASPDGLSRRVKGGDKKPVVPVVFNTAQVAVQAPLGHAVERCYLVGASPSLAVKGGSYAAY